MLSIESLKALKIMDDDGLWELGAAFLQVQGAILRMGQHVKDPDILRDLEAAALESGRELGAVKTVLRGKIDAAGD